MTNKESGFYWVTVTGDTILQVARWDGQWWDFCGAYCETDDRVQVMSERLVPPNESVDVQLKRIGTQITEAENSLNNIEFGKLGEHMDGLFGAMSVLSKK